VISLGILWSEGGVHLLEAYSLSYGWICFCKLGFDLASCGIDKEISAFIGVFFLFYAILV
jgi:hypothetical protein